MPRVAVKLLIPRVALMRNHCVYSMHATRVKIDLFYLTNMWQKTGPLITRVTIMYAIKIVWCNIRS